MKISTPINRNNLFYSEEDFEYETDIIMQYMEEDTNQTVVVYEVDRSKTAMNEVYQESVRNIRFKTPREIPCLYEIKESEIKTYDIKSSNGTYVVDGGLTIYVMDKILDKYKCDIKKGDYIGVLVNNNKMIYYSVVNDGRVNTSNSMIVGAYRTPWRVITAAPTTLEEFDGK